MDGFAGSALSGRSARTLALVLITGVVASLAAGCGVDVVGEEPPLNVLFDPVGIAVHPTGRYLYVVNSNFDLNFREDRGGTINVIDADSLELIPSSTLQIGTFGGDIALNTPPDGDPTQAYVAVRGDRSVVALGIEEGGARLRCQDREDRFTSSCRVATINQDPFGLAITTTEAVIDGEPVPVDFIGVAHLLGGNVTGITLRGGQIDSFSRVSAPLVSGANDIARSPRNGHFYTTSRFTNTVVAFRPVIDLDGGLSGVFETAEIPIDNARPAGGLDSRGIAFNKAGTLAFVANRGPDSLVIIDTGPTDLETGAGTRNRVVDIMLMPSEPAEVAVIDIDGKELIYITSFEDRNITVVDPELRAIVDTIELFAEPYAVAVDQVRHNRLYATLFSSDAIAVIDIDPASPSFNQVTAVIR